MPVVSPFKDHNKLDLSISTSQFSNQADQKLTDVRVALRRYDSVSGGIIRSAEVSHPGLTTEKVKGLLSELERAMDAIAAMEQIPKPSSHGAGQIRWVGIGHADADAIEAEWKSLTNPQRA